MAQIGRKLATDLKDPGGGRKGEKKNNEPSEYNAWYMSGWASFNQSSHFLAVPPNSQY